MGIQSPVHYGIGDILGKREREREREREIERERVIFFFIWGGYLIEFPSTTKINNNLLLQFKSLVSHCLTNPRLPSQTGKNSTHGSLKSMVNITQLIGDLFQYYM